MLISTSPVCRSIVKLISGISDLGEQLIELLQPGPGEKFLISVVETVR
jgi:hypothetical protein